MNMTQTAKPESVKSTINLVIDRIIGALREVESEISIKEAAGESHWQIAQRGLVGVVGGQYSRLEVAPSGQIVTIMRADGSVMYCHYDGSRPFQEVFGKVEGAFERVEQNAKETLAREEAEKGIKDLDRERTSARREIGELRAQVDFLKGDRIAIVAERNEAQERVRELEARVANLRGANSSTGGDPIAEAVRKVMKLLKPADIDKLMARDPASLTAQEAGEVALWQTAHKGRMIRFVAELATMTDIEADYLDGSEVRTLAQMLWTADNDGAVKLPRLYSDEDRNRAAHLLATISDSMLAGLDRGSARRAVDAIAEMLGLRRAGA